MNIVLKVRPLPVRLWLSYRNYRAIFGRWDSLCAAIELQWLYWRSTRTGGAA